MMSAEVDRWGEASGRESTEGVPHRVLASCSLSKVFCLFSSSIRVTVTSFSFGFDSAVVMGRVTPRYLGVGGAEIQHRTKATVSWWFPHGLSSCKAMALGFRRRMSGLKLQVFVEVQTQPTRGVCRYAGHPQTRPIPPQKASKVD